MALALITGGGSGIGAVLADRLASRGHDLILVGRDPDRLHVTARALTARYDVRADALVADLATRRGLFRLEALLGGPGAPAPDVLVHDAIPGHAGPGAPESVDEQQSRIDLGITATMRLTHAALPGMLRRGSGTVIAVGASPDPGDDPVTAWALAFTAGLAGMLDGTGVRVVTVRTERAAESVIDTDRPVGLPEPGRPAVALLELPRRAVDAGLRAARRGAQIVSDATREPLMPAPGAPGAPAARESAAPVAPVAPVMPGSSVPAVSVPGVPVPTASGPAPEPAASEPRMPVAPRRPVPAPGCDRAPVAQQPLRTPSRLPDLPSRPGAGRSVGTAPGCGRSDHYVGGSLRTPEQRARAAAAARDRARRRIGSAHTTATVTGG
ncbi:MULTISPECIES: SDR family NAD(P)-dependent oxidoreductase [Pseudonocardia]|uniref:Short-subunit dehydrogenase n=2 Tax=Pseudonocardia TaxID=1847 RepID=A0ABQ0S0I3_9PSEU|nr:MULTISPECIES: SDR family NAD(P)-dependent oxidoreductase [Pseudonocardia]OSY37977.1 putative oxidoreductase [Pseudonocardia autotrophica]TDN74638.1 short-subunit dehydrogenase [Pseudonocardia autotrophica]BBG05409.1 hypothetical protein Pdca_66180 [Pseudonocardia autotrophica]GEC26421.1 hypothetical protein PSA01_34500 [Pseudonocardia saturnea]